MLIDIFELQRVNKWLETTRHLLRGVWIDDKDRPHLVVSGILAVAIFTHGLCFSVTVFCHELSWPALNYPAGGFHVVARDGGRGGDRNQDA